MNGWRTWIVAGLTGGALLLALGCAPVDKPVVVDGQLRMDAGSTRLILSPSGAMTTALLQGGKETILSQPVNSESLHPFDLLLGDRVVRWRFDFSAHPPRKMKDGSWQLFATPEGHDMLQLELLLRKDPSTGNGIELQTIYRNDGNLPVMVNHLVQFNGMLDASSIDPGQQPCSFWAFLGGSYPERYDWVAPLDSSFFRENYQGMNDIDFGGGIPAIDIWTGNAALLVGSVSDHWRPVSLPVKGTPTGARIGVERKDGFMIPASGAWDAAPLLILAHRGDVYDGLHAYGRVMEQHGLNFPTPPESAYDPMWCAWGYERQFKTEEIYRTLPKVKELGYKWVGLDDGYQTANGDWNLIPSKFPRGDAGMEAFVDTVHAMGMKAMLWWVPGDADPRSAIAKENPNWIVQNKDGTPATISWWDTWYLDPTNPAVLRHQRDLVDKFLNTWGYDGLKTDGQCFNLVPPDYGNHPDHPFESSLHSPDILRVIYEQAHKDKPEAVLYNCPCGCVFDLYNMPYTDQYVSSDPESSWQIRSKGLVLRALVGDKVNYCGDHVELSDGGNDFASQVGVGAVPCSKFIWPETPDRYLEGDWLLTPDREKIQKHWLGIYEKYRLSKAHYRSLYVLGFDPVEAYAFEKDGNLFYSFYADHHEGSVELRGLEAGKKYRVTDYDRGVDHGTITGPKATIPGSFDHHLLLVAVPE